MNKRGVVVAIHVLCCLAFLALPYIFASGGFGRLKQLGYNPHEFTNLLSYLLMIGFFYLNYYVLIPRLFFKHLYVLYGLSVIAGFLSILVVLVGLDRPAMLWGRTSEPVFIPIPGGPPPRDKVGLPPQPPYPDFPIRKPAFPLELSHSLFLFLVGVFVSLTLRINNRWRETEHEKLQAELSYLKAQINPHFLFNTLNSIYSLAIDESDQTADAIVKLSAFLRYIIQDAQHDQVSLAKELEYIEHYVTLQKIRLDDTVQVDFRVDGAANGKQIAPLILISFIENAFKYGVSPEEESIIQIYVRMNWDELHCHVFNRKVKIQLDAATSSGIGLTNTTSRLQLVYPNRHKLLIYDNADGFAIDLFIRL